MMETILGFLFKCLAQIINSLCTSFLSTLNLDTAAYVSKFPFIDKALDAFKTIGIGFVLLIAAFQLSKFFFGPLSNAKEAPTHILLRAAIAAALVWKGDQIIALVIDIAKTPYNAFVAAVAGTNVINFSSFDMSSVMMDAVTMLLGGPALLGVKLLGALILMIAIAINLFKLMLEICERFLMVGILAFSSPLTFSTIASGQTSAIFGRWLNMFFGECIVMMLSVWSFGIALSGISKLGGGTAEFFLQMMLIIAACKVGMRMDSYMQQIGVNTATTGGSLLDEAAGAFALIRGVASRGKSMAQGRTNRDGVLGGIKGSDGKVKPDAWGGGLFGAGVTAARYAKNAYQNGASAADVAKAAKEGASKGFGIKDGAMFTGRKIADVREARAEARSAVTAAQTGTMHKSADGENVLLNDTAKNNGLRLNKDGTLGGTSRASGQFLAANYDKSAAYQTAMSTMTSGDPAAAEQFMFGNHNDLKHNGYGSKNPSEISKQQHDALGAAAMTATFGGAIQDLREAAPGTIGQKEKDAMRLGSAMRNTANGDPTGEHIADFRAADFKGSPDMGRQITGAITDKEGKRQTGFEILDQKAYDSLSPKEQAGYMGMTSATGANYYTRSTPIESGEMGDIKAPYDAQAAYPNNNMQMTGAEGEDKLFGNSTAAEAQANPETLESQDQTNAAAMGAMLSGSMSDAVTADDSGELQKYASAMQGAIDGDASGGYLSDVKTAPVDANDPSKGNMVSANLNDASGTTVGAMQLLDQKAYDNLGDADRSGYTQLKSESGQSYYMKTASVQPAPIAGTASGSATAAASGVAQSPVGAAVGGSVPVSGGTMAGTAQSTSPVVSPEGKPAHGGGTVAAVGGASGGTVSVPGGGSVQPGGPTIPTGAVAMARGGAAPVSGGTVSGGSAPVSGGSMAGSVQSSSPVVSPSVPSGGSTAAPVGRAVSGGTVVTPEALGYGHIKRDPAASFGVDYSQRQDLAASDWRGNPMSIEPILSERALNAGAGVCADGSDRVGIGLSGRMESDDDMDLAQAVKEGFTTQAAVPTFHDAAVKSCQTMSSPQAAVMMYESATGNLPAGHGHDSVVATAMTRAYSPDKMEAGLPVENGPVTTSPVYGTGGDDSAVPTIPRRDANQFYPTLERAAQGDVQPDSAGRYCDNFGIQGGVTSCDYHTPTGTYRVQSMNIGTYEQMRDEGAFARDSSVAEVLPNDLPDNGIAQFRMVTSKLPEPDAPRVAEVQSTVPTVQITAPTVQTVASDVSAPTITVEAPAPTVVAPDVSRATVQAPEIGTAPVHSSAAPSPAAPAASGTQQGAPAPRSPGGANHGPDTSSAAVVGPEGTGNGSSGGKRRRKRKRR